LDAVTYGHGTAIPLTFFRMACRMAQNRRTPVSAENLFASFIQPYATLPRENFRYSCIGFTGIKSIGFLFF